MSKWRTVVGGRQSTPSPQHCHLLCLSTSTGYGFMVVLRFYGWDAFFRISEWSWYWNWFLLLLPASRFGWCDFLAMLRVTGKVGENGQSSSQWPRRSAWIRPSVAAHGDMSILVGAMTVWRIWLREWRAAGFTFCVFTCSLWTYVCVYSHKLVCDRYRLGHRPVLS